MTARFNPERDTLDVAPADVLGVDAADLNREYPSIAAPPDDGFQDIAGDADDSVYQHGMEIAQDISKSMVQHGRTRRDLAAAPHS